MHESDFMGDFKSKFPVAMYSSLFLVEEVSIFLVILPAGDLDLDFDVETLPPLCYLSSRAEFFLE